MTKQEAICFLRGYLAAMAAAESATAGWTDSCVSGAKWWLAQIVLDRRTPAQLMEDPIFTEE